MSGYRQIRKKGEPEVPRTSDPPVQLLLVPKIETPEPETAPKVISPPFVLLKNDPKASKLASPAKPSNRKTREASIGVKRTIAAVMNNSQSLQEETDFELESHLDSSDDSYSCSSDSQLFESNFKNTADHSSPTIIAARTLKMDSLQIFIKDCFNHQPDSFHKSILRSLNEVGVDSFEDLKYLDVEKDLPEILKPVQVRKLKAKIEEAFSSNGATFTKLQNDPQNTAIRLKSLKKIIKSMLNEKEHHKSNRILDNSNISSSEIEILEPLIPEVSSSFLGTSSEKGEEDASITTNHDHLNSTLPPYSCPQAISVKKILSASARGCRLLKMFSEINSDTIIKRADINELVRVCVDSMLDQLQTLYPTSNQKLNLAKAIVTEIPALKSSRETVEGYEHFFDPISRSGLIEWRLKTLRVKESPSKRKNKRKRQAEEREREIAQLNAEELVVNEEAFASKITWLKCQTATDVCRGKIFETMNDTFEIRRQYIHIENPSIGQVLEKYPRFKDFQGDLIDEEFRKMYPGAGNFLEDFPSYYAPRITKYASNSRPDLQKRFFGLIDENLLALLILAELLPVSGPRKRKVTGDQRQQFLSDTLFRYVGVNGCLEEAIKKTLETGPYILCAGGKFSSLSSHFIILDKQPVDAGQSPLRAFDLLYKCFHVFNVEYPEQLRIFFNFMDTIIYKMTCTAKSSVENFNTIFCNTIL